MALLEPVMYLQGWQPVSTIKQTIRKYWSIHEGTHIYIYLQSAFVACNCALKERHEFCFSLEEGYTSLWYFVYICHVMPCCARWCWCYVVLSHLLCIMFCYVMDGSMGSWYYVWWCIYDDVDVSMVMFNCNGIHGSCMATFGQALKESSGISICAGV